MTDAHLFSTEPVNFVHPFRLHPDSTDHLEECGFLRYLLVLFPNPLLRKQAATTLRQLFLPLRDLGRMDLVLPGELAERLLLFQCIERSLNLEVGARRWGLFAMTLYICCSDPGSLPLRHVWSSF